MRPEARRALLDEVAADLAVVALGPHHRHVGHRAVGDPELGAVQHVLVALLHGARLHAAGVGAVVGLGEAEAAERRARLQARQPALLLRVGAVAVDRVHHEPALHRGERAEARVAALQLLHDEPVGHVVEAGAAVPLERGAEHAHLAELGLASSTGNVPSRWCWVTTGRNSRLHPVADGVAHHALLLGEELVEAVVVDAAELLHGACPFWRAAGLPGAQAPAGARRYAGPGARDRRRCTRRSPSPPPPRGRRVWQAPPGVQRRERGGLEAGAARAPAARVASTR